MRKFLSFPAARPRRDEMTEYGATSVLGTFETSCDVRSVVANGWEADMARQPNSVENDPTPT
jgi:hypothetical protein